MTRLNWRMAHDPANDSSVAASAARFFNSDVLHRNDGRGSALLYGGVALGVLAGAALSTYWWRQRTRALDLLQATPFERVEDLISSCENKIKDIERAIDELKDATRD